MSCAHSLDAGARSLVGWSTRLITGGSGVQVPSGPLFFRRSFCQIANTSGFIHPSVHNGYEWCLSGMDDR